MRLLGMLCMLFAFQSLAINDTLYINRADVQITNYTVQVCSFNDDAIFQKKNVIRDYNLNTSVDFVVYNTDTVAHELWLTDGTNVGIVQASSSLNFSHTFSTFGTFALRLNDFIGQSLGAAATLRIGMVNEQAFIWNLWDVNALLSEEIGDGIATSIPTDYKPNLCTINRESYPNTASDPEGAVTGNVGDTIYITIVNGGNMVHTLHFHGYHVDVLQATKRTKIVNWTKDSLPVYPDETMTVRLVPDKEGMYPVHDHNLVNVLSNGNTYPGGMITQLNIQP